MVWILSNAGSFTGNRVRNAEEYLNIQIENEFWGITIVRVSP